MEWLRAHPYVSVLVGVSLFLLVGFAVVATRTARAPGGATGTWSGTSGILTNPAYQGGAPGDAASRGATIFEQVRNTAPFAYTTPVPVKEDVDLSSLAISGEEADSEGTFDFEEFITLLSTPRSAGTDDAGFEGLTYDFLPQGFIATSTVQTAERTPAQSALFDYGNEVGSSIQSFEDLYPGQTEILTNQFEDRGNEEKGNAVRGVAQGMKELAITLESIDLVPALAVSLNRKLAESYRAMGERLMKIPDARDDSALLNAINDYNAAVDGYIEQYVALAELLSASGVRFGLDDPGSIFTFTAVSL
jgi:hypothetical protein